MSLIKTWYSIAEAEAKFGVSQAQILSWVEDGVVRTEETDGKVVRVNGDDLGLKVDELTGL
ncbi:hypothetical protein GURASL_08290 [Geotalea uraniireducens]|uniref:MerR family transcriptional regulator n=1 Tax=Geotalea uraniireducens TaxID=351604 RepID=A0ABN6VSU9_9BACT|nr:MerR family transcriptional regulator [Geotalea uraniireducens]BDV41906.1 hypothetical protein GURASL_08290 [Geotalea uraniireducens]